MKDMKKSIFILCGLLVSTFVMAQYNGETKGKDPKAISKEDASIISWAKGIELNRKSNVTYGRYYDAIGKADTTNLVCVSLGNGGIAVATFDRPIINGNGFDFVVFENAFDTTFMELAFVEVSSDGEHFFRFPSISTATSAKVTQTSSRYYNLAGRHLYKYGEAFDLSELEENAMLDKNNIRFVRLVDVLGGVDKDSQGNTIYEYDENTYINSSGFDLSGIGIINGGEKYKVADMEGLLSQTNTYELASSTNKDEDVTATIKTKNYSSEGLYFKGVAFLGNGYEMAMGWGPSNVSDTSVMKATDVSGKGWNNSFYVAASMAGVDGLNTGYLQAYYSNYNTEEHNTVTAINGNEFYPIGVYVAQSLSSFDYVSSTSQADLWFKIVAVGYDGHNNVTDSMEVYLRDARENGIGNFRDWRYLDLVPLGKVAKVQFIVKSNDVLDYIPTYMCMDNFVYSEVKGSGIDVLSNNGNAVEVTIYPNPATEFVTINTSKNANVRIMDIQGRVVYSQDRINGSIQVNNLKQGTYIVNIISDGSVVTKKLIVK